MSTADDVVRILQDEGGYRELPKPLRVGSQAFEFNHALIASDRANDLVVVIEIRSDNRDEEVVRKVLGLTRALDVMRSRRPVTAILTSGQPAADTVRTLSSVCRVLPIGTQIGVNPDQATRGWLSVLLPLKPISTSEVTGAWEAELAKSLDQQEDNEFVEKLLAAGKLGEESVKAVFADSVREALSDVLDEGEAEEI